MYRRVLIAFTGLFLAGAVQAATIQEAGPAQTDPGLDCSLRLNGEILPGDAKALIARLDTAIAAIPNYPSHLVNQQIVLCLSSPGGSFIEAVRMAKAIRDRDVTTRVAPGEACLSACAIAFMGGNFNTRSGMGWKASRYLHPTSRLGFHAPALNLPTGEFTRQDVLRAYDVAIEAVGLISREANTLRMPQALLTEMVNHRGQDFFYISTLDHVANFNVQLYGYSVPRLSRQNTPYACMNAWHWHIGTNPLGDTPESFRAFAESFLDAGAGLVEFLPFDGSIYCKHQAVEVGAGTLDSLVLSEWQTLQNARMRGSHPSWIRFPGPTPLADLPAGPLRDF